MTMTVSALFLFHVRSGMSAERMFLADFGETYRIDRVIDGDTIILDNGETVRLIGVDAPETHHPEIPAQRFGEESTDFLRQMIQDRKCTLKFDPNETRDKYGRLLAYVFVEGKLVNAEIIRRGYAYAYTRFNYQRKSEFLLLEREAREKQYGLWDPSSVDTRTVHPINDQARTISWQDAAKHYGKYATVEGTIVKTYNSGKACFLNFHIDYKNHFTAVIFAPDFPRFPKNPEVFYKGKEVRISGYIKKYKGSPEMILNHPGQIVILK